MMSTEDICHKRETVGADLGGHRRVWIPFTKTVGQRIQDEEARRDSKSVTCFSVVLGNATLDL